MSTIPVAAGQARRMASRVALAMCGLVALAPVAHAQTPLSDTPILASQSVPGNVALPLSVEWPTTQRMAHTD
ncbi:MAG: hypothetical protein ABI887_18970, partial [Burkholderiales bacterium]